MMRSPSHVMAFLMDPIFMLVLDDAGAWRLCTSPRC